MPVTLTLLGPREIIDEISQARDLAGVKMDEPQAAKGLADAVDSPIGPQEIETVLQLLTIGIGTATSAVVLFQKIKDLVKKSGKGRSVRIKNPKNNETIGEISETTDIDQLANSIGF
jgi:hypothetical protein